MELYFPSHLDTTTTAKELPNTFTAVLAMSSIRSIPAMKAKPSAGIPTEPRVARRTTKDTPGTPAIPFEVSIN